jgi:hypothetical protein
MVNMHVQNFLLGYKKGKYLTFIEPKYVLFLEIYPFVSPKIQGILKQKKYTILFMYMCTTYLRIKNIYLYIHVCSR